MVFAGARGEYDVVENGDGSFTVTDTIAGRDGTDTVFDMETFRFSDADFPASEVVDGTGGGGGTGSQASATLEITITPENDAPDDIAFAGGPLAEDAAIGTLVGTAAGDDPDGDALAYSLLDDAGGLFAIDAATGAVTLAGALDYETAASHTIEIQIEDPSGETYSESFVIGVTDVVDETVTLTSTMTFTRSRLQPTT